MKTKLLTLLSIFIFFLSLNAATDQQMQNKAQQVLQLLVSSHTKAFGLDNIYKEPLSTQEWNQAFTYMKNFIAAILNEYKNPNGTKDAVLTDAFTKIETAEIDLVNAIKLSRTTLKTPQNSQQIKILLQIKNDMIALQAKLDAYRQTHFGKNEAKKLLKSAAMFIETTASKAIKDSVKR